MSVDSKIPPSTVAFPLLAVALFGLGTLPLPDPLGAILSAALIPVLFGAVFAAVHHAEVIALRTGEPYGTLVLTMAVTAIEVALIASLMLKPDANPALARDTVFAVIMIVCNGLVGLCILAGGLRFGEIGFRVSGAGSYLAVLAPLATLSLVLPNYTLAEPGPSFAASQLVFVSVVTILLYGAFVYIQTVRHREHFTPRGADAAEIGARPGNRLVGWSSFWLLVALVGVILLSKSFAAVVEAGTNRIGAPDAVIGVVVALLILLPEGVAAVAAARRNELQRSLNLALGSSLATIGLTIPAVALVAIGFAKPLVLGLNPKDSVLLVLTLFVSVVTFGTGRTTILFGFVHLVLFATFVFLVFVP